jgi:alkyl hydroperoxide reductase subunit AhpC
MQIATVQRRCPDFRAAVVSNGAIQEDVSLGDLMKDKNFVVLLFYPLDFTFVCPTELIAFSDRHKEFEALGAQVVGVSVDSHFSHLAWVKTPRNKGGLGQMNIPLVADLTKEISRDYGVLIEEKGIALRGMFIIDKERVVRSIQINDLPVGRSVDEALRLVKAFDEHAKHGDVIPCNWQPGKPTLDTAKADEYFSKNH